MQQGNLIIFLDDLEQGIDRGTGRVIKKDGVYGI